MNDDFYVNINDVAKAKGLTSTRALRLEINKINSKYIARKVKVNGGESYEILYSSLESFVQEALMKDEKISTALVPVNYQPPSFESESAKLTALARYDIVKAALYFRTKYKTKKEADALFLQLFNMGEYLPKLHSFVGNISIGTLYRWMKTYKEKGTAEALAPNYKYVKTFERATILDETMQTVLLKLLLHHNKFKFGKAIKLAKAYLRAKCGYDELPCDLTFKRFGENFRDTHFDVWTYAREGEKAYHDKAEAYIERDISLIDVGDVLVADGHVLNFLVQDPITGKPARATLVGFLDWKSSALVGYEIMMTENTQCIASALRNAILNLGIIPKVVYQDNGKGFKAKFFQNCDFEEEGFNGVYANLGIRSVFAKPYNARAKVIERFFLEFQEELEKGMPSYIGTSIEDKPAWMKRGEHLHRKFHEQITKGYVPTINEAIQYINGWLEFHNSQACPHDKKMTINECLRSVQKQNIPITLLNDLMMETKERTINKHKELFFEDVQSINTQELPDFDILCAGFPCQSFSIAGKRRGFEDTRGTMFFEVARILKDKRPRYFILENVKGLLNHESGKTIQTILKILSDIGYKTQWQLLNSKFFSVPQNRERIYIVGCLGNECTGKIFPITDPSSTNTRTCEKQNIVYWKNSKEKWVDEEKSEVGTIRTQSDLCRQPLLKQLPETKGYSQGNRIYDSTGIGSCLTANGGGQGGKAGLYYVKNGTKKGYDEANIGDGISLAYPLSKKRRGRVGHGCSQTLDTSCSMGTIDNSRIRRLTPLECFRLQGFPDDMYYTARKLGLADTHLYKMAGNAVTVNVVEAVAKRLAEAIKDLK